MQCPTSKTAINFGDTYTVKVTYENEGLPTSEQIQIVALIIVEGGVYPVYYDTTVYLLGTLCAGFYPASIGSQETVTLLTGVNKICELGGAKTYTDCGMHIFVIPFNPSQGIGVFSYLQDDYGNIAAVSDAEFANTLSQAGAYAVGYCDAIIDWSVIQC